MNERVNSKSLSNLTILNIFHRDFVVTTRELNKEQICPEFDCCATFLSYFETIICGSKHNSAYCKLNIVTVLNTAEMVKFQSKNYCGEIQEPTGQLEGQRKHTCCSG